MADTSKGSCVQNVGCNVRDCKHHSATNICTASHIDVKNESAQRKAETFCGTFAPKSTM